MMLLAYCLYVISFFQFVHFCLSKNEPKRAAVHLASQRLTALRCSQKADASECRFARPSRFSAFCFAAWLREMAEMND
jgi:hypothetical protein